MSPCIYTPTATFLFTATPPTMKTALDNCDYSSKFEVHDCHVKYNLQSR